MFKDIIESTNIILLDMIDFQMTIFNIFISFLSVRSDCRIDDCIKNQLEKQNDVEMENRGMEQKR